MMTELAVQALSSHPYPGFADGGGPGWWLVFPIAFWILVISTVGYLNYRRTPARVARGAAERTLAERYARGEISEDEWRQRRAVLRGRSPR